MAEFARVRAVVAVRADAVSAAALPVPDDVIELLVVADGEPRPYLIGPVAAKTLILLLQEAVEAIEP